MDFKNFEDANLFTGTLSIHSRSSNDNSMLKQSKVSQYRAYTTILVLIRPLKQLNLAIAIITQCLNRENITNTEPAPKGRPYRPSNETMGLIRTFTCSLVKYEYTKKFGEFDDINFIMSTSTVRSKSDQENSIL